MAKRKIDETVAEVVESKPIFGTVKTLSNFRAKSNADSAVLMTVSEGTKVEVLNDKTENGFYNISFNDVKGYIRSDLIEL